MQLGLREGNNSVYEMKIYRDWSPKFCAWLGRVKKKASALVSVIQALLKTRKGGSISVFEFWFIFDELLRAESMSINS